MKVRAKKRLLLAAGLLTLLLGVGAAAALSTYNRLSDALNEMTQPSTPTRELGVYVLADDPAQALEDAAGYTFGGLEDGEASLTLLGQALGGEPDWEAYPTAFALADALQKGERQAVLLEEAYQKSLADARGYEWTEGGMRKIGSLQVEEPEAAPAPVPPEGTPESFVVYLSGSDTFGDISTRSRSDVNILAAVDVPAREVLLVATPRDYYVSFSRTDGREGQAGPHRDLRRGRVGGRLGNPVPSGHRLLPAGKLYRVCGDHRCFRRGQRLFGSEVYGGKHPHL